MLIFDAAFWPYWQPLEHFVYVTGWGFSATDAFRILTLKDRPYELIEVWNEVDQSDPDAFIESVTFVVARVVWCNDCEEANWRTDITRINGCSVCDDCRNNYYSYCESCDSWVGEDDMTYVNDWAYCGDCSARYISYCEDCDTYYHNDDAGEHDHSYCDCEPPRPSFIFPANGNGTVEQNERLHVELPSGMISTEGVKAITQLLQREKLHFEVWRIQELVENLDPQWQKKEGNFTRRLSKAMYQTLNVKVPVNVMSEVGNIARQHTGDASEYWVEFTRDLNGESSEFGHEESCWWGGYSYSRCSLKNWGGLALRTYEGERQKRYDPAGRAWVLPMKMWVQVAPGFKQSQLQPTHDTMNPHAYAVFNGYGNLQGYTAARIVAYLTGKTYRKISLGFDPMFVNCDSGYLVADEEICDAFASVSYSSDQHDQTDHQAIESFERTTATSTEEAA